MNPPGPSYHIIVYAKNSIQQLKLSNIQRDGFTIYYYYFYTHTNKLKGYYTIDEKNNNQWKIDAQDILPPLIKRVG